MTFKFNHLLVCIVSLFACSIDPECNQETPHDEIIMTFYDKNDSTKEFVRFDLVSGVGSDSIFYDLADSLETFSFQLNPATTKVTYYFLSGVSFDTVVLEYSKELEWLSETCGPNFHYGDLEIVHYTFDSVSLVNSEIDVRIDENIQIYN